MIFGEPEEKREGTFAESRAAKYREEGEPRSLSPLEHPSYALMRRIRTLLRQAMLGSPTTTRPPLVDSLKIINDYLEPAERETRLMEDEAAPVEFL